MKDGMCSSCNDDAVIKVFFEANHEVRSFEEQKTMVGYYCRKCYPIALNRYLVRIKEWFE